MHHPTPSQDDERKKKQAAQHKAIASARARVQNKELLKEKKMYGVFVGV